MSAQTHLASLGVTMAQAKEFILANVSTPVNIYNVAKQFGVTNDMLAEIYGGVTAADVKAFFVAHGFNAALLDGTGSIPTISTSMSGLTAKLSSMGLLAFSDKVMAAWRDAGADFDMDHVVEKAAENLGGKSVSEVGLTYLLNAGIRMTEADATKLAAAYTIDPAKLMSNPSAAAGLWSGVVNFYNGLLDRPAPTAVTQEMLDSVATGYVTAIGQIKPMADMLAPYGINIF